jgi:4-amino-4-deoxy-L-arabinose transferase-like glycosyltransferase
MKKLNFLSPEIYLILAALLLLFGMLSSHHIWTEEYRWQSICAHMISSHDYFHPYLDGHPYYDKPLLSYWLIVFPAKLFGGLNRFWLRFPSAISAGLTIWGIYGIGRHCFNRAVGLLAAWLLLTTFYFVFWARVSSADMLNVAFIVLPVFWFIKHPTVGQFKNDLVFFLLLAIGALLKGLIAPILTIIVLLPLLYPQWRKWFSWPCMASGLIAILIYLIPFLLSSHAQSNYGENGLYLVFRENVLRYVQPFDHEDPWYTYFIYTPVYTAPWIFLLPFILFCGNKINVIFMAQRAQKIFPIYAPLIIFLFLSFSGSRRSYYILPIVPFMMLSIAIAWNKRFAEKSRAIFCLYSVIGIIYFIFVMYFIIVQPLVS